MTTEIRCLQCAESFPAHVVEQFGGMCPACVAGFAELPNPAPDNALDSGSVFGRYEIVNVLGRGGMGVVYLARQTGLDRLVALKVLSPRLAADQDFVNRFSHEAKALARLSHPNIVAVHDSGVEAGLPFLAMEYVDGENLRVLLRKRRLDPERAIAIVPQLCNALEYAHAQGIIHRDIKPENILLDRAGGVKIADFGLAMIVGAGAPRLTQTNAIMGTPHYMAPEQVENPKAVDHRADIYSMGVVFYEMLTGELPIGAFSKPSEKARVSRQLDEIVLRALAKEPLRRYQHAKDLRTDLSRAPLAPSSSRVVKGYEWKSRAALFGWPLVHICFGQDDQGRMLWAKGVIAIGNRAIGAIAIGGAAIGLLALGGAAIGLMALGGGALGLLLAWGGGAIGGVAVGGGALGGVAFGGGAYGYYAMGGGAGGRYVVSPQRRDPEAERFFSRWVSMGPDFYQEGMRAWNENDGQKAVTFLLQVPLEHPKYPEAMSFLGYDILSLQRKDPEAGLNILSAARRVCPNNPVIEAAYLKTLDKVTGKSR
jgi:predicted Ser/Thr protein kinase